jgi:Ala-tRNA(Pro) deacylase
MPIRKLKDFLKENKVKYTVVTHEMAYTAQETAASAHVSGKGMAKTVMLKVEGKMMMAVLSASRKLEFHLLKSVLGTPRVEMAGEADFKDMFPECEIGAMPPFGNLYGLHVIADGGLAASEEILFNAGSHTELIRMPAKDFFSLVKPKIADISSAS